MFVQKKVTHLNVGTSPKCFQYWKVTLSACLQLVGTHTWITPCTWMLVTSDSGEHIWMFLVPKGHHGTGMIEVWPKFTSVNTSWYYMFMFHYFRNNQLPHSNYIGIGLKKWTTQCSIPHSPGLVHNTVLFICCGINAGIRRSSLLY